MRNGKTFKSNLRIISRLDVKRNHLVKGIELEGLRKVGLPNEYAKSYYEEGIDEIIYMDIVASLYNRNSILSVIEKAAESIFVPLTVGGGIRTLENVHEALGVGADKVAVNTAAIKNPKFITSIAESFGSQCMVLSIEAKKNSPDFWEAYYDNGREHSGKNVIDWAKEGVERGAGEILLTSVDHEGRQAGMDIELIKRISQSVKVPVIASGGIGSLDHITEVSNNTKVDAIAIAHCLHYEKLKIKEIKEWAASTGDLEIRL